MTCKNGYEWCIGWEKWYKELTRPCPECCEEMHVIATEKSKELTNINSLIGTRLVDNDGVQYEILAIDTYSYHFAVRFKKLDNSPEIGDIWTIGTYENLEFIGFGRNFAQEKYFIFKDNDAEKSQHFIITKDDFYSKSPTRIAPIKRNKE